MTGAATVAVLIEDPARSSAWLEALARAAPQWRICDGRTLASPEQADFLVLWGNVEGLARYRGLKAILSLGAGVDHVLRNSHLPPGIPLVRMVDPGLTQGMREYVMLHVLRHHLHVRQLEGQQKRRLWRPVSPPRATDRSVGVMGLGAIGGDCATQLAAFGFRVSGWSRRRKALKDVAAYAGPEELDGFLRASEILVCLLPLTDDTRDILDAALFSRLPAGAAVINAARGEHLVEADLLAALGSGHLSGATIDVFRREPLPEDHPFWTHPDILVTPHIASLTQVDSGARSILEAARRILEGESPPGLVDRASGY